MRILHTGDIHIGEYPGPVVNGVNQRHVDITKTLEFMVGEADRQQVDLFVIAGDGFKTKRPSYYDIVVLAHYLRMLSNQGTRVLIISGNHDIPNDGQTGAWEIIQAMQIPGVTIMLRPGIVEYDGVQFACMPYFSKSTLLAKDEYKNLPPDVVNQVLSQKVSDIVYGLKAEMDPAKPSVLVAHMTVVGCELDNGEHVFLAQEPVLPLDTLRGCNFDLTMLGHIHKAQDVQGIDNVFYCGSPERLSFGEEGQPKGYYLHDISAGELSSRFNETQAREFITINLNEQDLQKFLDDGDDLFAGLGKDAIVRVKYTAPDELAKRLNHADLTKRFYADGAHYVHSIIPEVTRTDRARDEEVTEDLTPMKALCKYMTKNNIEQNTVVMEAAALLIEEVGA